MDKLSLERRLSGGERRTRVSSCRFFTPPNGPTIVMKKPAPIPQPLHAAALGCIACVGLSTAARAAEPAPAPPPASEASAGWISRVKAAPKKLAFWNKEQPAPAAREAAPPPAPAASAPAAPANKKEKARRVATAAKPVPPTPAPAPALEPPKESFWSKLNPFDHKPAAEPPPPQPAPEPAPAKTKDRRDAPAPTPAPEPAKESLWSKLNPFDHKPSAEPAPPRPAAAPEKAEGPRKEVAKKNASSAAPETANPVSATRSRLDFLTRWWGGADDATPNQVDPAPPLTPAEQRRLEKLQVKANKALEPEKKGQPPAAPAAQTASNLSFWNRLLRRDAPAAATAPQQPATPLRVVRGAAPIPPSGKPAPNQYVVNKDKTPFYLYGPNQATPPDAILQTGTMVYLKSRNWGWAEVTLPDGRSGIMARDALRPATAYDLSPIDPAANIAAKRSQRPNTPSYALPPAPLPELPALLPDTPVATGDEATPEELTNALLPPYVE